MGKKLVKVHFWSDIPGQQILWGLDEPLSTGTTARGHARHGERVANLTSILALKYELNLLRRTQKADRVDFHTHGGPGRVKLGRDKLDYRTLKRFRGMDYDQAFNPGARIFFHGCNIAEGAWGELFLAEFGSIFLKSGGGRVGASTSVGFGTSSKEYHFWGNTVYAEVRPGGSVTLKNHTHLDAGHIQRGIENLEKNVLAGVLDIYDGRRDWEAVAARKAVAKATPHLMAARRHLSIASVRNGSWFANLNDAHAEGEMAERHLKRAMLRIDAADRARAGIRDLLVK